MVEIVQDGQIEGLSLPFSHRKHMTDLDTSFLHFSFSFWTFPFTPFPALSSPLVMGGRTNARNAILYIRMVQPSDKIL